MPFPFQSLIPRGQWHCWWLALRACFFMGQLLLVLGCATAPIHVSHEQDPALEEIAKAFTSTVTKINNNHEFKWHNGWLGNIVVKYIGGRNLGYCYHWQNQVYKGVVETVKQQGWQAEGVAINIGTIYEHHAVLVYDPKRVNGEDLLADRASDQAYVLDAWRRGQPDIYTLRQW